MENEETITAQPEATTAEAAPTQTQTTSPAEAAPVTATASPSEEPTFQAFDATPTQSVPAEDFSSPETVLKNFKGDKAALYKTLAKEQGYDDFILGLNDYYKQEGSFDKYLAAKAVDWTKVPQEDLLAMKLEEDYTHAGFPHDKIQRLIQHKLQTVYGIGADPDDPESVEVMEMQLKAMQDADAFRTARLTEQQRFQVPQRPDDVPQASPAEIMQADYQRWAADEKVSRFLAAKTLAYGDFNYEVSNPQETLATVVDDNRYKYHLAQRNEKGEVVIKDGAPVIDGNKLMKVAAYAQHMDAIEKALIEHGRTLGKKQTVDEAEVIPQNNRTTGSDTVAPDLLSQIAQGILNR